MAVTIKDVARLAQVSTSTVSRVCNNNPAISRETQERVRRAMQELGYEPAKPEAPASIRMVGIVLPPSEQDAYENTFYLKAIRGISQVCNQRSVGSTVITGKDYPEILHSIRTLHRSGRIDGFILLYSRKKDIVLDYLWEQGILYVMVGKPSDMEDQTICIDNDNLLAARQATDYLYDLGHRRIGYLGNRSDFMHSSDRRAGWQLSLLLHGLPASTENCVEMEGNNTSDGVEALRSLLSREDRPTAFVVSEDILALSLERVCAQMQLTIPGDISIIAFNNSLYTEMSEPQLTSVDINAYQLGQEAAVEFIRHLEDPDLRTTKIIVPHKILERDSCRAIDA